MREGHNHRGISCFGGILRTGKARAMAVALFLVLAPAAQAERTKLKPGWNLFSPAQDVEMGREVSKEAERELPLLNDRRVDEYLNQLGQRLARKAPGERYPYQFKTVNDRAINAFALPGGFLYVNRGVIEAAENESQLAGVMAHEIGHVALRHGTNQASKAYLAQAPLAVLGGVLGSGTIGAVLAQIGAGFATNSVLLKFSRDAERQADLMATQILYDNRYDPRAMAEFFQKIEAESKGGRPPAFFSSHPNPENRIENVNKEIEKLGGRPRGYETDSAEFREMKRFLQSLPAPSKAGSQARRGDEGRGRPPSPSDRYRTFEKNWLRLLYPDNWRVYGEGSAFTLAPEGGIVEDGRGGSSLAYGMIVSVFEPHGDRYDRITLEEATDQLIDDLRHSNPRMRVARRHERERIGGEPALSTLLSNESSLGGREYNWIVTVLLGEDLVYFVGVAPEGDYDHYERAFQTVLDSVRFTR
ncbi:MAG: M48 family metalloprotease [Acidobacteria bacterium]|nr:M48 family metalloprotease [Acidobacteriota bacterium]